MLVAVGFVPAHVPNAAVTVPIAFVAAMQMGLFRTVGTLSYMAIATTGNLMRFTEAGYAGLVDGDREARRSVGVYAALVASFAAGAVLGSVCTRAVGGPAAWIPAGLLGVAVVLFYLGER